MSLLVQFKQHFNKNFASLLNNEVKCIVAVSGGIDSVVLVDLLHNAGVDFTMAHCNFKLRGAESERDEAFVKTLAEKYSKQLLVKHFDTNAYASEHKLSIQIAARKLRYEWFNNIQYSAFKIQHYLLTAHHKNDNIETVLFNFFRGTGIQGLTGIKDVDKERKILRPLLIFSKEEIKNYATQNDIAFVEDSSNASNKYTRNSFRNEIIPMIEKHFSNVEENVFNNIGKMNDVEELYHQAIAVHKNNLIEHKGNEIHIPILKLKKANPVFSIVYEIIKEYGFTAAQTHEVVKLLDAHNGSYVQSASHRIINNRNWLIIAQKQNTEAANIVIEKTDTEIAFEAGTLLFEINNQQNAMQEPKNNSTGVEYLNLSKIEFPLLLRKWKQGDYFYPLGMQKKQKLSKFFINQKLSAIQKEKIWVLESNKKIIYVLGLRIDNRFKLHKEATQTYKITYLPR